MIEGLKPYAEYRDSGQRWLGHVPAHWHLLPNRALFDEVKDRDHPKEDMLSVTISRGIIRQQALLTDSSKKDSSNTNKDSYKLVQPGDLAYNKMRAWQGAVGTSAYRGIISPAYVVMRPRNNCLSWYYHHLLRTPLFAKEAERWSYGITSDMWSLRPEHFKIIYSVQPPPDEQVAIVRFLDHANRKIDGFIRSKRKLIALLNEQKQAIIHRAVTRGLDPHVPLKPSGIPWLGDIPQHWEQHSLWTISKLRMERNPGNLQLLSVFLDRGVIRYDEGGGQVHAPSLDLSNYQVVHPGDFVLNNQQAWRGSVGISSHHGIISPAYIVLRMSSKLNSVYANYLMRSRSMVDQFVAASKGVGDIQRQVFWPFLRMVQVPCPSLEEQAVVVEYLVRETRGLEQAISRTEREITLMQEYRTRLTADVVTGKLDVRAAAALPAEAYQPASTLDADDDDTDEDADA
jgi:type I restriction enzyme S subunit